MHLEKLLKRVAMSRLAAAAAQHPALGLAIISDASRTVSRPTNRRTHLQATLEEVAAAPSRH